MRRRDATWVAAVVLTGAAAAVAGVGLVLLLHLVQHLAFGYTEQTFLVGVERASSLRRVLVLTGAGVVTSLGWWGLRRRGRVGDVRAALADPARGLPVLDSTLDALLQVLVVGLGASLGREGAPRQVAATAALWISQRLQLEEHQRRVLLAAGAGAGLGAVYDVPFGGAVFAAEILLASWSWRVLLPLVVTSWLATVLTWPVLHRTVAYQVRGLHLTPSLLVWAVLVGPLAVLVGTVFVRLTEFARRHRASGRWLLVVPVPVFAGLGLVAIAYPQLLGNGKGPAQLAFDGGIGLGATAAVLVLKPIVTASCLAAGAAGGLLTPALATGALLGAVVGAGGHSLWPGTAVGGFALVAAAAVLAVTQRAPVCATVLVIELTHPALSLVLPIVVGVSGAMVSISVIRAFLRPTVTVGTERVF